MILYSYWRSTTSYRVRIALNLKGLSYRQRAVDLVAGDQRSANFAAVNPGKGVPALVLEDGTVLTQSMAILDYLDGLAAPALLPTAQPLRARVLAAAMTMATDVHPVNNLRVVQKLRANHGADADAATQWMLHWMTEGLTAFDALIDPGPFCFGDAPTLADICLVAQLYNAHRWGLDMTPFPRLSAIETHCLTLPAFAEARPEAQPDAT